MRGRLSWRWVVVALAAGWGGLAPEARAADPRGGLAPFVAEFFEEYCYRCHGDETQKGDRRLDRFPADLAADDDAMWLLEEALDAMNLGDMPPKKKDVAAPSNETKQGVIDWITGYLHAAEEAKAPATTVMRRLNRFEYVNTLRDLLGVDTQAFDPTGDFPADAIEHGFDNIGEALTLSDYQLRRYVEVAEAFLDEAVFFGEERPRERAWRYTGHDFNGVETLERAPVTWQIFQDDGSIVIGQGQPKERHVNYVPHFE
ncbi:MAG: DUF1587 domain-containing protein, partial [Planctomycetota bacterium]